MPSPTQQTGRDGEALARTFLRKKGYRFVEQNWHCRWGELDLIMMDGSEFVFVEVKLRANMKYGAPEEMIDWKKRKRLQKSAFAYLRSKKKDDAFWRFDTVAITGNKSHYEIEHFQDTIRDDG